MVTTYNNEKSLGFKNMTYRINEQEIKGVLALPGNGRYEHFVKRIADWKELWGSQK